MGNEIWYLYINATREKKKNLTQTRPLLKNEQYLRKTSLFISLDQIGIICIELLPRNVTINLVLYCEQLSQGQKVIVEQRLARHQFEVIQMENTRPRTATMMLIVLQELIMAILPHPAYFPDLESSYYYLFRAHLNALYDRCFSG